MKKSISVVFFSLMFLFICMGFVLINMPLVYAENSDIAVNDISALISSYNRSYHQADFSIGEGEYVSKTVTLLDKDGVAFEITEGDLENGEMHTVTNLPENIISITYNNDYFKVDKAYATKEVLFEFKYQVEFTFEDTTTLTKTANISIAFHNYNISLIKTGDPAEEIQEVTCDLNTPLSADDFKQYIDESVSTVSLDEITATFISPIDFYTLSTGAVKFTFSKTAYEIGGKTFDIKIEKTLSIIVDYPADWEGVTLQIASIGGEFSNELNIGTVEYQKNWEYSGQFRANIKGLDITHTNMDNFSAIIEETAEFGVYNFTIFTDKIIEGEQHVSFSSTFDGFDSNFATFSVTFTISSAPTIILSNDDIVLSKGVTYGEVKTIIEENLFSVSDIYGTVRDNSVVTINQTVLSDLYSNDSDILACRDYVVTYSYKSEIITHRDLTTTVTFTITVANDNPTINDGAIVTSEGSTVKNNDSVYANKSLDFVLSATDLNNDDLIFDVTLSVDGQVTAGNVDTTVIKNSNTKFTLSSITVDKVSQISFSVKPSQNYIGTFTVSIGVYDNGLAKTTADKFEFTVTYYETGTPVIVLLTTGMTYDDNEQINVLTIEQETTHRNLVTEFITRVSDEFDTTLDKNDLVLTVTKGGINQSLVGTTFTFREVGVYYVNYSVTDASGNKTTARFKVVVNEIPNSTPTFTNTYFVDLNEETGKEYGFKETIVINMDDYFTVVDVDVTDVLTYYHENFAYRTTNVYGETILCVNGESFSWNGNTLTFKQDPENYYVGTLYIAVRVDDNTGLPTGISAPAYIKITFVDNTEPIITQTNTKTTFVIGRDTPAVFNQASYFTAVNQFDNSEITPVVDMKDKDGQTVTNIDFTVVGTYTLTYYFKYTPQGGSEKIKTCQVTINIVTGGIPTIVLSKEEVVLNPGQTFNMDTIISQIQDDEDGNLTYEQIKEKLQVSGMPEDMSVVGEYNVTVTYFDNDGNKAETTFKIIIREPSKAWIYVLIGVGGALVVAGVVILIIFISRRRYTRI